MTEMSVKTPAKILQLGTAFFDVDRMIGTEFETGLANLKKLSEG